MTINAPDWETTRLAMCAARLHQPADSQLTLGQYLTLLRGWVEVLKRVPKDPTVDRMSLGGSTSPPPAAGKLGHQLLALHAALLAYQVCRGIV